MDPSDPTGVRRHGNLRPNFADDGAVALVSSRRPREISSRRAPYRPFCRLHVENLIRRNEPAARASRMKSGRPTIFH